MGNLVRSAAVRLLACSFAVVGGAALSCSPEEPKDVRRELDKEACDEARVSSTEAEPGGEVTVTSSVSATIQLPDGDGAVTSMDDGQTNRVRLPLREGPYTIVVKMYCGERSFTINVKKAAQPPPGKDGGTTDAGTTDGGTCGGLAGDLLAAGADNGCARACGCAYCWGANSDAQLGLGNIGDIAKPTLVPMFASASSLSTAFGMTCFVENGNVSCLGKLTPAGQSTPTPMPFVFGGAKGTSVFTSGNHACATTDSGHAWCWGNDANGAVGDGYQDTGPYDRQPFDVGAFTAVAVAAHHSCAVTPGNGASCWGETTAGNVLGVANGGDPNVAHAPSAVLTDVSGGGAPIDKVVAIATGRFHSCALLQSTSVMCWGSDQKGQLGDGAATNNTQKAVLAAGLTNAMQISAGGEHTCALLSDKTVACWGANEFGQLGDGTTSNDDAPVAVKDLTDVARVVAGNQHTCAQRTDGAVYCWGNNKYGTLGLGTTTLAETKPQQVVPPCR